MAGLTDSQLLELLKIDLQRLAPLPGDDTYLPALLAAARASLTRQGIPPGEDADYGQLLVGTAAWIYRKRISGEAEPAYLRRLRLDLLLSRQAERMRENA